MSLVHGETVDKLPLNLTVFPSIYLSSYNPSVFPLLLHVFADFEF